MNLADSTHHGINFAHLLIHRTDTVDILDIHLHIPAGSANADNFMSTRQGLDCSLSNHTGSTYDNYFHNDILNEAYIFSG
jgi:hypothetical protein